MDVFKNLFSKNSSKKYTSVTELKPGAFGDYNNKNDIEFTDLTVPKSKVNINLAAPSKSFGDYRVSPMAAMRLTPPVYSQEDLHRIADMFVVTYTHITDEAMLPNYQKSRNQKTAKNSSKFLNLFRKVFS